MLKIIGIALVILIAGGCCLGQTPSSPEHPVQGYVYIGPGAYITGSNAAIHYGVGVDGLATRRIGVGAELGGFAPAQSFSSGFGVFSPNASYHFLSPSSSRKFDPFVTGGYTMVFRSGVAHAVNLGGGFNYWIKERVGLRVEIRDHIGFPSPEDHLVGVRFGVSFR